MEKTVRLRIDLVKISTYEVEVMAEPGRTDQIEEAVDDLDLHEIEMGVLISQNWEIEHMEEA